jgi:hypothetical protein
MQYIKTFSRSENIEKIETIEQARFIKSILETLDIPANWNVERELTFQEKTELKQIFNKYDILIIEKNGGIKIFIDSELVAEWYKPIYKLKEDVKQPDRKKKLIVEMSVSFWSMFDQTL